MGSKKKKRSAGTAAGAADKEDSPAAGSAASNELHERIWSVVSFEGVIRESLTYDEAAELLSSLEKKSTPGLCIVTDAVAERLGGEKMAGDE